MRKDMAKVIVERPRSGRSWPRRPGKSRALLDDDGAELRSSSREPRKPPRKSKWLNENLAPLKRYLRAQVGRPWNKVYAEISTHLKPTSAVQQHVRDHLDDFVARNVVIKGAVRYAPTSWGALIRLEDDARPFYVHPRTGILSAKKDRVSWSRAERARLALIAAERATRMREIGPKLQLHKLKDDVWWEVKLAGVGDGSEGDVVLSAELSPLAPDTLYGRPGMRAIAKRVLSKAEKKQHGLA